MEVPYGDSALHASEPSLLLMTMARGRETFEEQRGQGRPFRKPDEGETVPLTIRVTPEERERFKRAANTAKAGSVSQWIRTLCEAEIVRMDRKK